MCDGRCTRERERDREDYGEGGADDTYCERFDDRPQQSATKGVTEKKIAADVWRISFSDEQPHLAASVRRQ